MKARDVVNRGMSGSFYGMQTGFGLIDEKSPGEKLTGALTRL
jgi:hypothetical protein